MRVRVDDTQLFIDIDGASLVPDGAGMRCRPTLVLLHGGPGFDHTYFKPLFAALADEMQILYVDHRGNGRSDYSDPVHWNLKTWSRDLHQLLKLLGIERPIVLGHSFGGMVAQCYGGMFPSEAAGLILYATGATRLFEESLLVFERLGGPRARACAQAFFADPYAPGTLEAFSTECFPLYCNGAWDDNISTRARQNTDVLRHFFANEARTLDLRDMLSQIQSPTLVIAGTDDPITPIVKAREIHASLPTGVGELRILQGLRHVIHLDEPAHLLDLVRGFVRRVSTRDEYDERGVTR